MYTCKFIVNVTPCDKPVIYIYIYIYIYISGDRPFDISSRYSAVVNKNASIYNFGRRRPGGSLCFNLQVANLCTLLIAFGGGVGPGREGGHQRIHNAAGQPAATCIYFSITSVLC